MGSSAANKSRAAIVSPAFPVQVNVQGDAHAGGTVSGVVLPRHDGKQAFSTGVAVPLRHLRERGAAEPIVATVTGLAASAETFSDRAATSYGTEG